MDSWDYKEEKRGKKQEFQEKLGKYMVVGGGAFLSLYAFTLLLESLDSACASC